MWLSWNEYLYWTIESDVNYRVIKHNKTNFQNIDIAPSENMTFTLTTEKYEKIILCGEMLVFIFICGIDKDCETTSGCAEGLLGIEPRSARY